MLSVRSPILVIVLLGLFIFLQYRLWFESGNISDVLQLKKKLAMQIEENELLKQDNDAILIQIKQLQHSDDAIESRARNELGMIKKDEVFYQVVK